MSNLSQLQKMGWRDFFAEQVNALDVENLRAGRVISEEKGRYLVYFGEKEELYAEVSGKLRHEALGRQGFPAVGDWVLCSFESEGVIRVEKVLNRSTCLSRKVAGDEIEQQILAANTDVVFIVCSMNEDLSLRRIERYLVLVWNSGAQPVILLTKSDLAEFPDNIVAEVESVSNGVPVHALSVIHNIGNSCLQSYLGPQVTAVLIGSSGVGKSTIVNYLKGSDIQKTQSVRDDDGKGKHTTTSRQLFVLENGALLIDTPGLREVQLWIDEKGLSAVFSDIEDLALQCKFTNCQHQSEPKCAIKEALNNGSLLESRLNSYNRLRGELGFELRKTDKALASKEKDRWKQINKDLRQTLKNKRSPNRS